MRLAKFVLLVPWHHNVADMFTKLLGKTIFHRLAYLMGMRGEKPRFALPELPALPAHCSFGAAYRQNNFV